MGRKVLLIGWDAADWKVIGPLLDAGKLPNLERLVNSGVMGDLATLSPSLSPMLWTSIATGKRAFKHGICGFTEPDPQSGQIRPVSNLSRKTRAVWNILNLEGLTCNVVGWWPSHPAEPVRGVMVSNHYPRAVAPMDKPWPLRPGTIHPQRLAEHLAALRLHPQEVQAADILPFVPKAAEVDQETDKRLASLAKILGECSSVHAAATALVQLEPWDFMAVYYDAIDHFCHAFMRYHPPRMNDVSEKDFAIYQDVVAGGYRFHDAMLGVLMGLAGRDVTVMLISDHGFHPDHLRPKSIPHEPAGPAVQHRHHGIFVLAGPGIKQDERVYGANLLDITPTILALYGMPVGRDMDGKPLVSAFEKPPEIETIDSWDDVAGEDGAHPADAVIDPIEAQESLDQLVALGYIAKPNEDCAKAVAETVRELRYNEACSYMDAGRDAEAAQILTELVEAWPDESRFGIQLVGCYQSLDRVAEAREALDALIERRRKNAVMAAEKLRQWRREHEEVKIADLDEKQQHELWRLGGQAGTNPVAIEYLQGVQFLAEGDAQAALVYFRNAELIDSGVPGVHLKKGQTLLRMKQWDQAEQSFRQVLDIDPQSAAAQVGLCRSLLPRRRNSDAAEAALRAVGLLFFNPTAHFLLGVALHRMGRLPRAIEALKVCLAQNPNYAEAHDRLAYIYDKRIGNPAEADEHRRQADDARGRVADLRDGKARLESRDDARVPLASDHDVLPAGQDYPPEMAVPLGETIVVVSGLPRSGTSMMMQMLTAGGLEALVDDERGPDDDNRRGYYEYAPVKRLRSDNAWVSQAKGKVVKVVAHLLPALPRDEQFHYRGIFMQRNLREVVTSQRDMLARLGRPGAKLSDEALGRTFATQLARITRLLALGRFPVVYVSHRDCIADPAATAARINAFLGGALDERSMAAAVEPELYRHRLEDGDAPRNEA